MDVTQSTDRGAGSPGRGRWRSRHVSPLARSAACSGVELSTDNSRPEFRRVCPCPPRHTSRLHGTARPGSHTNGTRHYVVRTHAPHAQAHANMGQAPAMTRSLISRHEIRAE
eukprot:570354-Prymnesium_polylepis.1